MGRQQQTKHSQQDTDGKGPFGTLPAGIDCGESK